MDEERERNERDKTDGELKYEQKEKKRSVRYEHW